MRRRSTSTRRQRAAGAPGPRSTTRHSRAYSVTVAVEDTQGASATIEVTIAVTDANEPTAFDSTVHHAISVADE